jgi:hypothetical protein
MNGVLLAVMLAGFLVEDAMFGAWDLIKWVRR